MTDEPLCLFVGPSHDGPTRRALGLDHSRDWRPCEHPTRPLGPHVCTCKGCGPTCPEYRPETELETLE